MRRFQCDWCEKASPANMLAEGWLTVTQHFDADHGGDITLHYCSTRCCEDDLDSLDLGGESEESIPQERVEVVSRPSVVSQPEKHDPLCWWGDVLDLARHDCDLCDLIAAARADERGES